MKKHWLRGLLLGVSLALLLIGGVVMASPLCQPPDPPQAADGVYVTTEDNVGNGGVGSADDDMGYPYPPDICQWDDNIPVEFNIMLDAEVCSDGELALTGMDWEAGNHEVYVNGHFVGFVPAQEEEWDIFLYTVPQEMLNEWANNLVEIRLVERECGFIGWGALYIEPCEEEEPVEEFVPEPATIMLLGSGLAGLVGYATLRWRTRE